MAKSANDMPDVSGTPSSPTSSQLPDWPLRRPASRRISNPVSLRLQTITEGHGPNVPPIPPRSSMRDSGSSWSLHHNDGLQPPPSRDGRRSTDRPGTAPPAYEWVPDPNPSDANVDGRMPVEGEKLAKLRRGGGYMRKSRGGMKRLLLILAVLFIVIVGLAVGLGVGLTVGRHHNNNNDQSSGQPAGTNGTSNSTAPQNGPFPLGEYSFIAELQTVSTDCTSDASIWTCSSNAFDQATQTRSSIFNWIIAKTDSNYATIGSGATSDAGIPANLTISSNDPFGIKFDPTNLTYIASSGNSSSARLTFSFVTYKEVITTLPATGNSNVNCFFNQTTFAGTLYLSAPGSSGNTSSTSAPGYQQWPYAIEITQSSPGGDNVPACYTSNDNETGTLIAAGFTPQSASSQCMCDYRNFS